MDTALTDRIAPELGFIPGSIHLVAIHPDRGRGEPPGRWFGEDVAAGVAWAADRNRAGYGIYFTANEVREGLNKKPAKADITRARFAHVDIDPRPGEGPLDASKVLARCPVRPSIVIHSGNGVQLLWTVTGEPSHDDIEDLNRRIAAHCGGDACYNVDRLLRVPGTINYPTANKRAQGREPRFACLFGEPTGVRRHWEVLTKRFPPVTGSATARPTQKHTLGDVVPISWEDLEPRPNKDLAQRITAEQVRGDRSEESMRVAKLMLFAGYTREQVAGVLLHPDNPIAQHCLEQPNPEYQARRIASRVEGPRDPDKVFGPGARPGVPGAIDPTGSAPDRGDPPQFLAEKFKRQRRPNLRHHRGEWLDWQDGAYRAVGSDTIRSDMWDFLAPIEPRPHRITGAIDALAGLRDVHIPDAGREEPFWLDRRSWPDPMQLLPVRNGIVDLSTGELLDPTPALFTRCALPFAYDPHAPEPELWLRVLRQSFPPGEEGQQSVRALQEFGGYCLTADTRLHKALMLIGPPRSGKSTIVEVMMHLIGKDNVASSSFSDLAGQFGLQPLCGKRAVIVPDARPDGREGRRYTERLLGITGGDPQQVNPKGRPAYTAPILAKFIVVSNEILTFPDRSDAMSHRFIAIRTHRTLGEDERDTNLLKNLLPELPGILNFFIEGWRRVQETGRMTQPTGAQDLVEGIKSDVSRFVSAECDTGPECEVELRALWEAYQRWYRAEVADGPVRPSDMNLFARDLRAVASVRSTRPRRAGGELRPNVYVGIALKRPDDVRDK